MPIPLSYLIIEPNKDKSDYLCFVSNSKMTIPRLPRQQKRRRVVKNVLEPSNCNAQLNNSKLPSNNTHPLVLPSQRLFGDVSTKSLASNTNAPQTALNAPASTSVPKENVLIKSHLGTVEKRKISDKTSDDSQSIEEKKPKIASKENLAQSDLKSKTTNSQVQNEMAFSEDDDSSTDVSETSYQIDLICKSESVASCGEVEKPSSVSLNAASSTVNRVEPTATTSNPIQNNTNHDTQIIKPSTSTNTTSTSLLTDPPPLEKPKNAIEKNGHSSPKDVHIENKPVEVVVKVEVKATNLTTSSANTVTVASLQQSTAPNRSLETTVKNVHPAEKNVLVPKEQNGNIITPTVISNKNTTFLLQSPKCDSTVTAPLKSSPLDTRMEVVFAHSTAVNKASSVVVASAQDKPTTNGHSKTTEISATAAANTLKPVTATNGKSKFCLTQFNHSPEFIKIFSPFQANIGNCIAQSSINIKPAPDNSLN